MLNRKLNNELKRITKLLPVITVTGPRQSGKTTLLKHFFKDYTYVNLEDIEQREFAENDPKAFLRSFSGKVILDEVQLVPKLFSQSNTLNSIV